MRKRQRCFDKSRNAAGSRLTGRSMTAKEVGSRRQPLQDDEGKRPTVIDRRYRVDGEAGGLVGCEG